MAPAPDGRTPEADAPPPPRERPPRRAASAPARARRVAARSARGPPRPPAPRSRSRPRAPARPRAAAAPGAWTSPAALASAAEMARFHAEDYIDFLQRVVPDNSGPSSRRWRSSTWASARLPDLRRHVRVLPDLHGREHRRSAAEPGRDRHRDQLVGRLYHAKKSEASGFYMNDIVLAILELLKYTRACCTSTSTSTTAARRRSTAPTAS